MQYFVHSEILYYFSQPVTVPVTAEAVANFDLSFGLSQEPDDTVDVTMNTDGVISLPQSSGRVVYEVAVPHLAAQTTVVSASNPIQTQYNVTPLSQSVSNSTGMSNLKGILSNCTFHGCTINLQVKNNDQ